MKHQAYSLPRPVALAAALGAILLSSSAIAANGQGTLSPEAQYRQDIARCAMLPADQDPAACKKEAGAALEAARKGTLTPSSDPHDTDRCNALPADQRQDCILQMTDKANTKVEGSVEGGGILRTTTITIPG